MRVESEGLSEQEVRAPKMPPHSTIGAMRAAAGGGTARAF